MRTIRPTCGFCGNHFSTSDDVNALKSFCNRCSVQRKTIAREAFADRVVRIANAGRFVLSDRNTKACDLVNKRWIVPPSRGAKS